MQHPFSNRTSVHLLLIAIVGLVVYSNTFHTPFIFDDHTSIVDNQVIRDLGNFLSGAGYAFSPRRFVGYLTLALNCRIGALDVTGYHIFNLAVHIISALLVYSLIRLTLLTPYFSNAERGARNAELTTQNSKLKTQNSNSSFIALFAALLFVSHPIQTQAVTYIIQRLASLATMFYLMSLVLYVKTRLFQEEGGAWRKAWGLYVFSLSSALLAMKTKEIAFTLPAVVLLYEVFFFRGKAGKRLLFLLPMLLTLAVIPLSMVEGEKPAGELLADLGEKARDVTPLSRGDYLVTQFRVIVTYLRLLVLPVNQNLDYDYPVYHSFFTPPVFLSFLFLLALFCLAVFLYYRSRNEERGSGSEVQGVTQTLPVTSRQSLVTGFQRLIAFGILWFFVTLSVESSVVPIADVIYEHRLYLPSVGAFLAAAAAFALMLRRYPARVRMVAATVVVLVLSTAAWKRNTVWRDGFSLWKDVAEKSPNKARAHDNLGYSLLYEKERIAEAIEEYRTALALKPDYFPSRHALGIAFMKSGLTDQAIEQFQLALKIKPNSVETRYNLAAAFNKKGNLDEAIGHYQAVLTLEPDNAKAFYNLGVVLGEKGRTEEAIGQFLKAVQLKPDMLTAHYNLGILYGQSGAIKEAIEHFEIAVNLKPDLGNAHFNLGKMYATAGRIDEARERLETAVKLDPGEPDFHDALADVYSAKGWRDKAGDERRMAGEMREGRQVGSGEGPKPEFRNP